MMDMMNARYVLLVGRAPSLVLEGHLEAAAGAYERPLPEAKPEEVPGMELTVVRASITPINESSRAAHPISRLAGPLWASQDAELSVKTRRAVSHVSRFTQRAQRPTPMWETCTTRRTFR